MVGGAAWAWEGAGPQAVGDGAGQPLACASPALCLACLCLHLHLRGLQGMPALSQEHPALLLPHRQRGREGVASFGCPAGQLQPRPRQQPPQPLQGSWQREPS